MKVFVFLSCSLLLCEGASAQFLREYVFGAAAPNNGSAATQASFGILPAPQPLAPVSNTSGNTYLAGVGGEYRASRIVGIGLDLAGIVPAGGKVFSNTIGTISPNGYLHIAGKDWEGPKVDFYGTAGYTVLFRDFGANGVNGGGGVNYWFKERLGFNFEYRFLAVFGTPPPPTFASHYHEIRFGLTFR